jgi:hypothetical protein
MLSGRRIDLLRHGGVEVQHGGERVAATRAVKLIDAVAELTDSEVARRAQSGY